MISLGVGGVHHPYVRVLLVTARGAVSETMVVVGADQAGIPGLAVSEQSNAAVGEVVAIELEPLACPWDRNALPGHDQERM